MLIWIFYLLLNRVCRFLIHWLSIWYVLVLAIEFCYYYFISERSKTHLNYLLFCVFIPELLRVWFDHIVLLVSSHFFKTLSSPYVLFHIASFCFYFALLSPSEFSSYLFLTEVGMNCQNSQHCLKPLLILTFGKPHALKHSLKYFGSLFFLYFPLQLVKLYSLWKIIFD